MGIGRNPGDASGRGSGRDRSREAEPHRRDSGGRQRGPDPASRSCIHQCSSRSLSMLPTRKRRPPTNGKCLPPKTLGRMVQQLLRDLLDEAQAQFRIRPLAGARVISISWPSRARSPSRRAVTAAGRCSACSRPRRAPTPPRAAERRVPRHLTVLGDLRLGAHLPRLLVGVAAARLVLQRLAEEVVLGHLVCCVCRDRGRLRSSECDDPGSRCVPMVNSGDDSDGPTGRTKDDVGFGPPDHRCRSHRYR